MAEDRTQPPPGYESHSRGRVWPSVALDLLVGEFNRSRSPVDGVLPIARAWDWRDRMLALLSGEAG